MQPPPYHTLDAKTFRQGVKHLRCQCCTAGLAFLTGVLAVLYELMLHNVQDRDFRDMLYDYRLTQAGRKTHHAYFIMGDACPADEGLLQSYTPGPPYCPPMIQLECSAALATSVNFTCSQAGWLLLGMLGLQSNGDIRNCYKARSILPVINTYTDGTVLTSSLLLISQSQTMKTYPITTGSLQDWTNQMEAAVKDAGAYQDPWYRAPSAPIGTLLQVDDTAVNLEGNWQRGGRKNVKRFGKWDPGLWPWKVRCPDTSYPAAYFLSGWSAVAFPAYPDFREDYLTFQLMNSTYLVPKFNASITATSATVARLSSVKVKVAMVPSGDACHCWVIDSVDPTYTTVWSGKGSTNGASIPASTETVNIEMRDLGGPGPLALPSNKGAMYIYIAICMGGIWMFSLVPIPFQMFVIYTNVRRNNGLPPPLYKYMRKYRGWGS